MGPRQPAGPAPVQRIPLVYRREFRKRSRGMDNRCQRRRRQLVHSRHTDQPGRADHIQPRRAGGRLHPRRHRVAHGRDRAAVRRGDRRRRDADRPALARDSRRAQRRGGCSVGRCRDPERGRSFDLHRCLHGTGARGAGRECGDQRPVPYGSHHGDRRRGRRGDRGGERRAPVCGCGHRWRESGRPGQTGFRPDMRSGCGQPLYRRHARRTGHARRPAQRVALPLHPFQPHLRRQ